VFKNLCHSFNINAQSLRRDTLCLIHLISMNPLKTYRQEKKEEPLIGEYGLPICNLYWDGELKISTPSLKRRMEKSNM
jgi:hypothetical protein